MFLIDSKILTPPLIKTDFIRTLDCPLYAYPGKTNPSYAKTTKTPESPIGNNSKSLAK